MKNSRRRRLAGALRTDRIRPPPTASVSRHQDADTGCMKSHPAIGRRRLSGSSHTAEEQPELKKSLAAPRALKSRRQPSWRAVCCKDCHATRSCIFSRRIQKGGHEMRIRVRDPSYRPPFILPRVMGVHQFFMDDWD
jgi:hypothetical protein